MSKIYYGADSSRLIPAPLVNISKTYTKSGDGEIIGKIYTLTITGTIIAWMGSPYSDGTFYTGSDYPDNEVVDTQNRLAAIQRKQEGIRSLFSVDGEKLEIQTAGGLTSVRCYPRIVDINFSEGVWHDKCEYTITLECDELLGGAFSEEDTFNQYISNASEEWSIDTNEESAEEFGVPRTYTLSHSISAQGKRFYDTTGLTKESWEQAKTFVLSKLGFDSQMVLSSGVLNLPSYYNGFNHSRNENVNKKDGSYSVTETWILASGSATEVFNVSTSDELESVYKKVNIEGTITGYDVRDSNLNITTGKWANAETKYNQISGLTLTRAQYFSGETLNISSLSETVGKNPMNGTIEYRFEYDTRPSNLISGARSEVISIADNIGGENFASVFVLGRTKGPVLQGLDTKPVNTRNLNIELVVEPETGTAQELLNSKKPSNNPLYATDIQNVINAAKPIPNIGSATIMFQDQPQENWDIKNFRYSYNTTWTFE